MLEFTTFSFYKYFKIENTEHFRAQLFEGFKSLKVLGRVYIAEEGINGQVTCYKELFDQVRNFIYCMPGLGDLRLNIAIEEKGQSFKKLHVKVRKKIVADGIDDITFDVTQRGKYLKAEEFNEMSEDPQVLIVDMRNHYEYAVGHFENAIGLKAETFREALPEAKLLLSGAEGRPIILYCTGGIRCEKASAWLKHNGFQKVFQVEGGIIEYTRRAKFLGIPNKFKGVNFVFDDRLGETITHEIISRCQQCSNPTARQVNCANDGCHLLFIQCETCGKSFNNCCSTVCQSVLALPDVIQNQIRSGLSKGRMVHGYFKKRSGISRKTSNKSVSLSSLIC